MIKSTSQFMISILVALLIGFGATAVPATSASAAGSYDENQPPSRENISSVRLEQTWTHLQQVYARQGERLGKAGDFIARIQTLIDRANAKGLDTTAVQAALDAFTAAIPSAQAAHEPGAAIITSHAGFDGNGKVTDRIAAAETVKAIGQVLKNTRAAMDGTGEALKDAIRAFWEAHGQVRSETVPPQ